MGSKGSNTTSSVQIPPSVLAQYNQVNQRANQVTNTPFQSYGGQFVAPVNSQEQTGIANTNTAAGSYQPYYNAATAATVAGGAAVDPTAINSSAINQYMSPYVQDVANSQEALNNQQYQQAQSGQLGTAIQSGAFGGDRAGVAAANLQQQQSLANNSEMAGILNTGYNNALATAQQQQGVQLSADQANRAAMQQTGQSLAGLGTATQTAGLTGAAAQTSAGQLQQQTQQAQDTALYNQFLQQQSLPYQQLQLAANVAEGTGSLSGSTTTTNGTQNGIFSDKRLKEDARKVGETFDGQPIYTFKYKGHPETHMGLMAQDVEMRDADAVGLASGYKTVDYRKATDKAAKRGHFAAGGAPNDWQSILGQYQQMYGGLLGAQGGINGGTLVPQSTSQPHELKVAQAPAQQPQADPFKQAASLAGDVDSIGKAGDKLGAWSYGEKGGGKSDDGPDTQSMNGTQEDDIFGLKRGGRAGLAFGGDPEDPANPYGAQGLNIPDDKQKYTLDAPKPAGGGGGGGNILDDAKDVASIVAMFARGGRAGRADGGNVDGANISAIRKALMLALNPMAQHGIPTDQGDPDSQSAQDDPDDAPDAANDDTPYAPASQQPIAVNGRGLGMQMSDDAPRAGHLDPQVVSFLKGKGLSDGQALGIAAGIYAESANNPNADNPSSHALGLGQWLGSRKKGLIGQFGDSPSKGDQLSYLMQELNGGDKGGSAVLGASDPSDVLNAYIKRFMRPHAGAETSGDINRGLGALRQGFADGGVPDDFLPDASDYLADQGGVSNVDLPPSRDAGPDTVPPVVDKPKALAIAAMPSDRSQGLATAPDNEADLDVTSQRRPDDLLPADFSKPVKGSEAPADANGDETHGSFWHNLKHGKADAIIPILTGLGAFGTANTSNPLTALATGLGAGAGEYQKMREFELEPQQLGINRMTATAGVMNQQNQMANNARQIAMGMYKYLPTNPSTPWLNTRTGQYETNEQHQSTIDGMVSQIYSRKIPGMPDMSLPTAPSVSATPDAGDNPASPPAPMGAPSPAGAPAVPPMPSAPNTITTPTLRPSLPRGASSGARAVNGEYNGQSVLNAIPPVDDSNVPAQNRISTLQGNYERLRAAGQTDAANAIQQQIQAINSGHQIVLDNNGQQYQGYAQHQQAVQAAQQTYDQKVKQRNADVGNAQQVVGQEYQPIHQLLTGMAHNLKDNNLNRGSPELANLIGQIRSVPGLGHIADAFAQYEGATDINQKSAALLAMKQAGSLSGAPAAALTEALETVPDATRDPAAKYKIITQALGNLEQSKDYANDLIKNQNKVVDTAAFANDWHSEPRHSATAYELRARKNTPYFAGMTPEQMQQAPTPGHAPDPSKMGFNERFYGPDGRQWYWNPITQKASPTQVTRPPWYKGN